MRSLLFTLILITFFGCQQSKETMNKPYVIEVTTFKYKSAVNANDFWKEDARIEEIYTSKQPGYMSR